MSQCHSIIVIILRYCSSWFRETKKVVKLVIFDRRFDWYDWFRDKFIVLSLHFDIKISARSYTPSETATFCYHFSGRTLDPTVCKNSWFYCRDFQTKPYKFKLMNNPFQTSRYFHISIFKHWRHDKLIFALNIWLRYVYDRAPLPNVEYWKYPRRIVSIYNVWQSYEAMCS